MTVFAAPTAVYEEFLKPTLLIALFAPPEELSAGVVLGAFYFYTLAHQSDFDVCWCKVPVGSVCDFCSRACVPVTTACQVNGKQDKHVSVKCCLCTVHAQCRAHLEHKPTALPSCIALPTY